MCDESGNDIKFLECESCGNVHSISKPLELTFVCSICGTINANEEMKEMTLHGNIVMAKTEVHANPAKLRDGILSVAPELTLDELEAIDLLQKYGWAFHFKALRKDFNHDD